MARLDNGGTAEDAAGVRGDLSRGGICRGFVHIHFDKTRHGAWDLPVSPSIK